VIDFKGKLIDLIAKADSLEWNLWVYSEPYVLLTSDTQCMAIDADNTELGTDDFTPLVVQECGFQELISMQDLQAVLKDIDSQIAVKAIDYYVKNDAYLPQQ
jgi:hypothetical protein